MNISLSWLKKYVDIDVPVEELCEKMIRSGFEVESIEDLSETMKNVVVGKVIAMEKHPDSDHLWICQVNIGADEPVQIITGAQNVFVGATVPAALHNSYLPDGTHITKGKLRGLPSNGMLCSGEELALKAGDFPGCDVYGIMIMDDSYAAGTDMREVLHLDDYIIDFKITANRPDCNCVLGVAREAAVALGKEFREPVPSFSANSESIHDFIKVRVEDYELCPRYMGRIVKNLRIKESPDWMKQCLKAAGMRPINNVFDISNFVMLEMNQPSHTFDYDTIGDHHIIVRRAEEGEKIVTLDDQERDLTTDMLLICDGSKAIGVAGVMGGQNTEITDDTKNILIECAYFYPKSIRLTSRKLGLASEAASRFEKGIDMEAAERASERICQLLCELAGGTLVFGGENMMYNVSGVRRCIL